MTCPICGRTIHPTDSIVDTEEGWAHRSCGTAGAIPRPPRPSVSDATIDALTSMQVRTWAVPAMHGQSYSDWLTSRIAAVTQLLIGNWGGWCPTCGALPLVELRDDTTTPMAAIGSKGR